MAMIYVLLVVDGVSILCKKVDGVVLPLDDGDWAKVIGRINRVLELERRVADLISDAGRRAAEFERTDAALAKLAAQFQAADLEARGGTAHGVGPGHVAYSPLLKRLRQERSPDLDGDPIQAKHASGSMYSSRSEWVPVPSSEESS